jgi:hypothetical protein
VIKLSTTPQIIFAFGLNVTMKLCVKDMKYKCGAIGNNLVNMQGNFFLKPLGTLGEYMGNHMEQIGNIDHL